MNINWLDLPKKSNFDAALSFLILSVGHKDADKLIEKLKKASIEKFAAKDILRAAGVPALPSDTEHVKLNIEKMKDHKEIGPVMLCRVEDRPLIIADGMHRVSAAWHLDEDSVIHALVGEL